MVSYERSSPARNAHPVGRGLSQGHLSGFRHEGRPASTSEIAHLLELSPAIGERDGQAAVRAGVAGARALQGRPAHRRKGAAPRSRMVRRHRLIEAYLVEFLGYTWDTVHDEAERLEHAVSDTLVERMAAALGHPAVDPHGDPIPTADGSIHELAMHAAVRGAGRRHRRDPPGRRESARAAPVHRLHRASSRGAGHASWIASRSTGRSRSRSAGTRTSSVTSWRRSCCAPRTSRHERRPRPHSTS